MCVRRVTTVGCLTQAAPEKERIAELIIYGLLGSPTRDRFVIHGQDIAGLTLDQLGEIRKKNWVLFQQAALYDAHRRTEVAFSTAA